MGKRAETAPIVYVPVRAQLRRRRPVTARHLAAKDAVLAASVKAAAGLAGLLHFRHAAATGGDEAAAEKTLAEAAANLQTAAEEINALFEMAARLRRGGSPN